MKAEELRIGNYLKFKNTEDLAIVELIHKKHFDCRDEKGYFTPNGNYEPIPLTEDWLIKFGFNKIDNTTFRLNILSYGRITFYFGVDYMFCQLGQTSGYKLGEPDIKYVHQLQNLFFCLSGEELTIKTKN